MKILTKKKQEKILELLIGSGAVVAENTKVPAGTFNKVNRANSNIADFVGGDGFVGRYHRVIDRILESELAKTGGK